MSNEETIELKVLSCNDKPCGLYMERGKWFLGAISGDSWNWAGIPLRELLEELDRVEAEKLKDIE